MLPKVNREYVTYDIIVKKYKERVLSMVKIAKRVKELRIDNDVTQVQMADYLGIDQSYYAKYENGKQPIPTRHIKAICHKFNVSADYILGLNKGLEWPR